ncbi:GIY-YIG nuclease family protein [Cylindrospermopsis raciborskii MVCC19]|nr:GIY-YIG nuclease family protein [Cylindrospermopsis raciborskii MVCC19]
MPRYNSEIHNQARRILDAIAFAPFDQCQPLSRDFSDVPDRPGIYAVRHRYQGLLYIRHLQNSFLRGVGGIQRA